MPASRYLLRVFYLSTPFLIHGSNIPPTLLFPTFSLCATFLLPFFSPVSTYLLPGYCLSYTYPEVRVTSLRRADDSFVPTGSARPLLRSTEAAVTSRTHNRDRTGRPSHPGFVNCYDESPVSEPPQPSSGCRASIDG